MAIEPVRVNVPEDGREAADVGVGVDTFAPGLESIRGRPAATIAMAATRARGATRMNARSAGSAR
jgi:hypothetical protein